MSRSSKAVANPIVARARLVLVAFVISVLALTTALAFAQEHGTGSLPPGHPPTGGAGAPPGHAQLPSASERLPSSGEHGAATGHEGAEHGDAHATAGGAHHGPEAINWTNIWDGKRPAILSLVINFSVLMTLYYLLGKKPVSAALTQRRVTIGKEIDEAQKLLEEAQERALKYQAGLKSADADAAMAQAALISAGKGEVERLLLEANERAERMKRDAARLVEQESKQVHLDILNETVDLAVHEASKLLAKSVTADDHARLAQDLLAELATRPSARTGTPTQGSTQVTGSVT